MIEQSSLSGTHTPLPQGFEWLRTACVERGGFFVETEHHVLSYIPGSERLVVCFDNLASSREKEKRTPFGFPLVDRQGWGTLGVMAKRMDWFQCPDLKAHLHEIQAQGLFDSYPNTAFYGASMGGFGALAFSPLASNPTVLAFAPQSTLRPRRAKFERRYTSAMRIGDWSGAFTDVAATPLDTGRAFVVFDPFVPQDRAHVERLKGTQIEPLPVRHFTHKVPPMLRRMEILKPIVLEALGGTLTRQSFYHHLRARRDAAPYLVSLVEAAHRAGHLKLGCAAAERAVLQKNNWKTRQSLRSIESTRDALLERAKARED